MPAIADLKTGPLGPLAGVLKAGKMAGAARIGPGTVGAGSAFTRVPACMVAQSRWVSSFTDHGLSKRSHFPDLHSCYLTMRPYCVTMPVQLHCVEREPWHAHSDLAARRGPYLSQIVSQVKYMVASGQLVPEEELPPIRVLAKQLLVTPNTVAKAYGELEVDGVIYKRRGAGTYVSDSMSPLARKEQRKILADRPSGLWAILLKWHLGGGP